jgi:hypothetical protein
MWNLRCGRDEAVQDDGDCGVEPETLQIVSQFLANSGRQLSRECLPMGHSGEDRKLDDKNRLSAVQLAGVFGNNRIRYLTFQIAKKLSRCSLVRRLAKKGNQQGECNCQCSFHGNYSPCCACVHAKR